MGWWEWGLLEEGGAGEELYDYFAKSETSLEKKKKKISENFDNKKFSKNSNKNQKVVQRNEYIFLENKSHGKKS